jgi:hypothetical protein
MVASPPTPRRGENVSDEQASQQFVDELLKYQLQRSAEQLESELWEAVAAADRGDLSREHYEDLMAVYHGLGEVLEFVDKYTYRPVGREEIDE